MAEQKVNLYDQISANKRKSYLLTGIFVVILAILGYILGIIFGIGLLGLILALIISIAMSITSYFYSDKIALMQANAQLADKEKYKKLYDVVEEMSIASGMPMPKVYIINDSSPNAFATGRDPQHSSIAVTTGLLNMMDREELEGVVAHEMSHVMNFDIRFSSMVIVLVGAIALIAGIMRFSFLFGGPRNQGNNNGGEGEGILMVVGLILAILAPIIVTLIQMAVSRKRESLADSSGALISRNPAGLASALTKIGTYTGEINNKTTNNPKLASANNATAHMYFTNPFGNVSNWFSTHPPIKERIKALESL